MRRIELDRDFTRRFPKCVYVVGSPSLPGRYVYNMYVAYSFSMKKKKALGVIIRRQVARETIHDNSKGGKVLDLKKRSRALIYSALNGALMDCRRE